jgi:hypothetical protein
MINGDGKLDLVVGETDNNLNYYQNTGTFSNPVYTKKTGSNDPFNDIDVGLTSTPTFHDIDGDSDLDLVAGENHGKLHCTNNQIIEAIAVDITCGGDWDATPITHTLTVNNKAPCATGNSR